MSNVAIEFAAIDTVFANKTPFRYSVNVYEDPPVLDTTILVTTVDVDDGTVYRVVVVVVVAAPLNKAFGVFGISTLP